jgi:hypothetical protein
MKARARGISQSKGSSIFIKHGLSPKYGIALEKRLQLAQQKSKALFPHADAPLHNLATLFISNKESGRNIVLTVNRQYSSRGFNPLYFSRRNILRLRENKLGRIFPLNPEATGNRRRDLDSS